MRKIVPYLVGLTLITNIGLSQKVKFGYCLLDENKGGLSWTLNNKPDQMNPGLHTIVPDNLMFEYDINNKHTIIIGAGVFRDYLLIGTPGIKVGYKGTLNSQFPSKYSIQYHQTLERSFSRIEGIQSLLNFGLEGNGTYIFRNNLFVVPKIDLGIKLYDRKLTGDSYRVKDYLRFPIELYLGKYDKIGLDVGTIVFHTSNDLDRPIVLYPDLYFGFIFNL